MLVRLRGFARRLVGSSIGIKFVARREQYYDSTVCPIVRLSIRALHATSDFCVARQEEILKKHLRFESLCCNTYSDDSRIEDV